ncbi:MAG: hypothetical protein KIS77_15400 [Saprospiraceae bacterium]|nr:hypothetical protein [Saprospiraceae bacterium]
MNKETLNDELKPLSPWLHGMKQRDDGFRVPDGYFDAVEEAVLNQVKAADALRKPVLASRRGGLFAMLARPKVAWPAIAATLALVVSAVWFFRSANVAPTPADWASQELTEEEIEAFLLENIGDFEAEQLFSITVADQSAQTNKTEQPLTTDELSKEELEWLLKELSHEELEQLLKT